jgi:glycerol-3-phosphate dehydrogenase
VVRVTPTQRAPHVVVLGGGSWGTTIASICARRGPTLHWVRSEETAKDINENHCNSRYLGNEVALTNTLRATTDFAEAADCADVVVMGVPSHGFRNVLTELASQPIDEIIASMNQVAEGVKAVGVVMEFADSYGIAMPIAREVDGVINQGATPEDAYRGLAAETPGHEVHGAGF